MLLPVEPRSLLVTFVDTPGLIPERDRLPFESEDVLLKFAHHSQLVLAFMDPVGQTFSVPLCDFAKKAHPENGTKIHFLLIKADTIDEHERTRIVSSIAQTLVNKIRMRMLDVRSAISSAR
jgi:hypothetical protein